MKLDEIPEGFTPLVWAGFCALIGPLYARPQGENVVIGLRIEPRHANTGGFAHGGLIASLADMTLTHTIGRRYAHEFYIATISLNIDFSCGARIGDWVEAHPTVSKGDGGMAFVHCDLMVEGRKIVHASGVLKRLRREGGGA